MAQIEKSHLTARMLEAAKGVLGNVKPESLQFAEARMAKMAEAILTIAAQDKHDEVLIGDAHLYFNLQKNVARCSLYGLKDVGVLAADAAIDAALEAISEEVNRLLCFDLL
ncbi:hypothetical protein [Geotalea sp. SG265]|uniref:hypothetical protein n=1 Tax=Geotalea sp. SG265 TaxID=2922867 RepID=UPI001FAED5B2|nr:hypothetical protein [Geotalea sp. SG265]